MKGAHMRTRAMRKSMSISPDRTIYLASAIDEHSTSDICRRLFEMDRDDNSDILLVINSQGGQLHSALAVIDLMGMIKSRVRTLALGKAMSCGALILMCGDQRFASPHSVVLLHEMSTSGQGKLSELEMRVRLGKTLEKRIESLIAERTTIPKQRIKPLLGSECYLNADEAAKMGIIDAVVTDIGQVISVRKQSSLCAKGLGSGKGIRRRGDAKGTN